MEHQEVLRLIRKHVQASNQRQVAAEWGVSEAYLSDVLNEKRNPGPAILHALGLQQRTTYSKINAKGT